MRPLAHLGFSSGLPAHVVAVIGFGLIGACSAPDGSGGATGGAAPMAGTTSTLGGGGGLSGTGGGGGSGGIGAAAGTGGSSLASGGMSSGGTSSGGAIGSGGLLGGSGSGAMLGGQPGTGGNGGANAGGSAGASPMSGGRSGGAGGAGAGAPPMGGAGGTGKAGAGGTGPAGGGGGTGPGGYQPCPTNGDPCKILPLGDSITWGIQYDGAYRVELFTKAVKDGKKITFTGSLSNGPAMVSGQPFPKNNEGHSGWTIDQDAGLVPSPAFNTIPNIVLLHIGTNDIYAASGQATMPDRLGKLIDKVIAAAPDALVVVAKITPLSNSSWNTTIKTYNDAIPGVVKTRADAGKHVIVVDCNTGFTSGMLSSDGVHPQKSGYDFMGDVFYSAISSVLH